MTENDLLSSNDGEEPTSVRRVGRRNRKKRLYSVGDLFAPQTPASSEPVESPPASSDETPEVTSARSTVVVTPPEERFPPIPRVRRDIEKNIRPRTETPPMAQRRSRRAVRQNRIAILFFTATALAAAYFVYIWVNPFSPLNPLAPPRPVLVVTATPPGMAALPFGLSRPVAYTSGECDSFQINGTIRGRDGEGYAVRVTNDSRDDGVIPAGAGNEHLFQFILPKEEQDYAVVLFDTDGEPLADPVAVQVLGRCAADVHFEPKA